METLFRSNAAARREPHSRGNAIASYSKQISQHRQNAIAFPTKPLIGTTDPTSDAARVCDVETRPERDYRFQPPRMPALFILLVKSSLGSMELTGLSLSAPFIAGRGNGFQRLECVVHRRGGFRLNLGSGTMLRLCRSNVHLF
jgi:hypothetical protein